MKQSLFLLFALLLSSFANPTVDSIFSHVEKIDDDMIGALYLFSDREGNRFAFAIKAKQANDPRDFSEWGIWMGSLDNPFVKERVDTVLHYFGISDGDTRS